MEFDGSRGRLYAKRFTIGGVTCDTFHDLTKGAKGEQSFRLSRPASRRMPLPDAQFPFDLKTDWPRGKSS